MGYNETPYLKGIAMFPGHPDNILSFPLATAQLQMVDQLQRMDRKRFAKKLLIGSAAWFAVVGLLATGMKMQQNLDAAQAETK